VSLFSHPDYDGHRSIHFHEDPRTGLKAIVAVHRLWDLPAVGGCRFWSYSSDDAAIRDALRLSRGMSYKCVMADAGYGGGKCVILKPETIADRKTLLAAMGDFVESLGGIIKTGMDVGLSVEDVEAMAARCSHIVGRGATSPDEVTARGVFKAMQATCAALSGSESLTGQHVALQGLGKIGMRLCRSLHDVGASLSVADIDDRLVEKAVERFGAEKATPQRIHAVEADIFSPCALGGVINERSVGEIGARAIVGAANDQLASPAMGKELAQRGILYAPDYIANAGGLLDVVQDIEKFDDSELERRIVKIGETLKQVYREAAEGQMCTAEAANRIALRRIERRDATTPVAAE